MSDKYNKFLGILSIVAVLSANSVVGLAEDDMETVFLDLEDGSDMLITEDITPDIEDFDSETDFSNQEKQIRFLDKLKSELNMSKSAYRSTLTNIADMEARLNRTDEDSLSLKGQLENLDKIIASTTSKLFDAIKNSVETENKIRLLYQEIEIKEIALNYQKSLLADYIRIIYEAENSLLSFDENGQIDAFKMLLADGSVGENMRQLEYFDLLSVAGQELALKLEEISNDLRKNEKLLTGNLTELNDLQDSIKLEKEQLEMQKESKKKLLDLTRGQEQVYSELLKQTLREQEELVLDIKKLDDAVNFIEQKILEDGENFNPDEYMDLLDYKTQVLYDFRLSYDGRSSDFIWPVIPERGISAYFRDPGYAGVFGVRHNAIDIPVFQGSPVRSAGHGVVYTTADNGYGYSYIIVAHANGLMTVYGHMSEIMVREGDTVSQGTIIGLSGGMPGTLGAGYMTTGPHLHFEILQNGMHTDPLEYLSLKDLREDQVEWLPDKYKEKWEKDSNFVPLSRF